MEAGEGDWHNRLLLTEVMNGYALGHAVWSDRERTYFGPSGASDAFRSTMVAHINDGYGVVVMTNSDNGSDLAEAVVDLIGKIGGWPGC